MITKDKMIDPILEVCPSFKPVYEAFIEDWKDEDDEPPYYMALADLARHLVSMFKRGNTECFGQVFFVVERWCVEGDDYVKEAATIGLLEGLQNAALGEKIDPEEFRIYLGNESENGWKNLYEFWGDGE